jgi:hypothetical protein
VKSGSAGAAFTPTLLSASNSSKGGVRGGTGAFSAKSMSAGRMESVDHDGDFVDRTTQEQLIEQKFVAIDEVSLNSEIIAQRAVDIERINLSIVEIHDMFQYLSEMVQEQAPQVEQILTVSLTYGIICIAVV